MKAIIGFGELRELLKTDKALKVLLIAGAVLLLFGSLYGLLGKSGQDAGERSLYNTASLAEYEHSLERRLAEILSGIDGVGKASVMVTLDTSERTEYGKNADMLISVTSPKVRGVIVVCEGGDSIAVKEKVVGAVTGVFGISSLHISVSGSK